MVGNVSKRHERMTVASTALKVNNMSRIFECVLTLTRAYFTNTYSIKAQQMGKNSERQALIDELFACPFISFFRCHSGKKICATAGLPS